MTGIEILAKIAADLNIPKQIIDKGEKAVKAVFGPSIVEFSETLGDTFRLRRFKNQVTILTKAQEILAKNKIKPKKIDLKILVPLLENCSLEEEELLQDRWANLIFNVVTIEGKTMLKQNCIDILKKITNDEAIFMDTLYNIIAQQRNDRYERLKDMKQFAHKKKPEDYQLHSFSVSIESIAGLLNKQRVDIELTISNLFALGLVKWETEVEVVNAESRKPTTDWLGQKIDNSWLLGGEDTTKIDIDLDVYDSEKIKITELGFEFVQMCKE